MIEILTRQEKRALRRASRKNAAYLAYAQAQVSYDFAAQAAPHFGSYAEIDAARALLAARHRLLRWSR